MVCERRLVVVAAVALIAGCGSGATTVGTASVPDPGGRGADGGVAGDGGGVAPGGSGGGGDGGVIGGSDGGVIVGGGRGSDGGMAGGGGSGGVDGGIAPAPCPRAPTVVARPVYRADVFTVDDRFVYSFTPRSLDDFPLSGAPYGTLVDDIDGTRDFALGSNIESLYWLVAQSSSGPGMVVRASKLGGAPTVLYRGGNVHGLVVDSGRIFFVDGATLWGSDADGANLYHLSDAAQGYEFALDDTYAWWVNGGALYRVPKLGGNTEIVLTWSGGSDVFISVGPRYVFVGGDSIRRIDKQTMAMTTTTISVGTPPEALFMTALAADGDTVWFGGYPGPNQPYFGRLDPDGHVTLVGDDDPSHIVVSGDSVYYHARANNAPAIKRVCR